MRSVEASISPQDEPFLAAQAAFHLGRLANEYGRPRLAREPLDRAEELFTTLNQPGWLAAVAWQRHDLPWASAELTTAVQELESAVHVLQNSLAPLNTYAPLCHLTLAYARLLKGDYDGLPELLQQCLNHFANTDDPLHQARTLFLQSAYLRRLSRYQEAKAASFQGLELVQTIGASADIGRFHCQIGFNHWLCDGDYEAGVVSFQAGIDLFEALNIPGWLAQCQDGLAQIYIMIGHLNEAALLLNTAVSHYREEEIIGQQPHALLVLGWLEMLKGRYLASLDYLDQSAAAFQRIGSESMLPVVQMHKGDTLLKLGRLQQSLQSLEQAYSDFKTLDLPGRLAECGLRLANLWTQLNNPKEAHLILEKVNAIAQKTGHASALLAYHFRTAEHHHESNQPDKALDSLNEAITLARQQKNDRLINLCHRQIAQIYTQQGQLAQAVEALESAESALEIVEQPHEKAAFLLLWGEIYHQQNQPQKAAAAWKTAEDLTREWMSDLNWQAAAALADLAQENGQQAQASAHYKQMFASLRRLRQGFWQPELAGSYLKQPSKALKKAVNLAAQCGSAHETLSYIEETKAQTTARRIQAQALFREIELIPAEIQDLMAEIRWLQKNLREPGASSRVFFRSAEYETQYRQLQKKIEDYTTALNRLQRQQVDAGQLPFSDGFELDTFRSLANDHVGNNWIALDYYQDGTKLVCLALTMTDEWVYSIELPDDLWKALQELERLYKNGMPPLSVLGDAGQRLLPTAVRQQLNQNQETILIIAPNRDLHQLPWSALHLGGQSYTPLVAATVPVIIPSLHTLSLLWQRETQSSPDPNGLLLGVSDFLGRHVNLKAVLDEVKELMPILGENCSILLNQQAKADALRSEMKHNGRWHQFWHIATHAFHDAQSGRLSGLALHDRDFWLDELWQLAPLPELVTFSACGGSKSHLVEGDEHIGLTTACLTAGANHVIGSIWDVPDSGMAGIMAEFYSQYLNRHDEKAVPVSSALAHAQRLAWANNQSWQQWAGFRCTGRP